MKFKMDLGGSGGSALMFVLSLLSALASLAESNRYNDYRLVPRVKFFVDTRLYETIDGDYITYGNNIDIVMQLLYLVEEPSFGCERSMNDSEIFPSFRTDSVFLLPDTSSPCSGYEKSKYARGTLGASGVIFYRISDEDNASVDNSLHTERQGRQTSSQSRSSSTATPTVLRLSLLSEQLSEFRSKLGTGSTLQVSIKAQIQQRGFKTSQTFYFVVFAFCILMMLSCSWLLLSYFKRCHYRWRMRRNQVQSANETRQMVNRLPTKSYKSSKEKGEVPTCVVCLDVFKNHDSIRILPCKHEFHKKCIDPWLKIKRNCPMCKQNIFPPKRRSGSSRLNNNNSETAQRRAQRAMGSTRETAIVLRAAVDEQRRRRSWSSSSSSTDNSEDRSSVASSNVASNTTQETDTSATSLLHDTGSVEDIGAATVIVVSPVITEETVQQQQTEGDVEMTVLEMETTSVPAESGSPEGQGEGEQREEGEGGQRETGGDNSLESSLSLSEHVGVDIEGVGLIETAPVVNA